MRFYLRYVEKHAWVAVQSEPALEQERSMQRGETFHRMAHQLLSGVPVERLSRLRLDDQEARWWRNFLALTQSDPALSAAKDGGILRFAEISLSAPFAGFRLGAKYDLVVVEPGVGATIYDWKTGRAPLQREWLSDRLQTVVYPYLLVLAGACLNGGAPLLPEQVAMVYWSAEHPETPVRFDYSLRQYERDGRLLQDMVGQIATCGAEAFTPTPQESDCRFCVYRSYCGRGERAGSLDEAGDPGDLSDFSLDLSQVEPEPF
jgi:hypothetical protein